MGRALELIAGQATAPGATFTGLTMAAGTSLTIRNAPLTADVRMCEMWAKNQVAGVFRVRSPKLHDNVQGIRMRNPTGIVGPMLAVGNYQKLVAQDTLVAEITGSAVGGQFEQGAMLIYYADLPGSDARLTSPADVIKRTVNIETVETSITPAAAGNFTGQVALNSQFDLLQANTDYALLGYRCDVRCTCVRIQGADTANLGVGGIGEPTLPEITSQWFVWLSENLNLALIPVFNSANKAGILCDIQQDQAAAVVVVTWIFAQLAPGAIQTTP